MFWFVVTSVGVLCFMWAVILYVLQRKMQPETPQLGSWILLAIGLMLGNSEIVHEHLRIHNSGAYMFLVTVVFVVVVIKIMAIIDVRMRAR